MTGRKTEAEKRNSEKVRKEKQRQAADRRQRTKSSSANDPSRSEVKGHLTIPFLRLSEHPSSLCQPRSKCPDTPPPRTQGCLGPQCPGGAYWVPCWAATSDLSGQLVSTVNARAHQGLRGEQPSAPAPAPAQVPNPARPARVTSQKEGHPGSLAQSGYGPSVQACHSHPHCSLPRASCL